MPMLYDVLKGLDSQTNALLAKYKLKPLDAPNYAGFEVTEAAFMKRLHHVFSAINFLLAKNPDAGQDIDSFTLLATINDMVRDAQKQGIIKPAQYDQLNNKLRDNLAQVPKPTPSAMEAKREALKKLPPEIQEKETAALIKIMDMIIQLGRQYTAPPGGKPPGADKTEVEENASPNNDTTPPPSNPYGKLPPRRDHHGKIPTDPAIDKALAELEHRLDVLRNGKSETLSEPSSKRSRKNALAPSGLCFANNSEEAVKKIYDDNPDKPNIVIMFREKSGEFCLGFKLDPKHTAGQKIVLKPTDNEEEVIQLIQALQKEYASKKIEISSTAKQEDISSRFRPEK